MLTPISKSDIISAVTSKYELTCSCGNQTFIIEQHRKDLHGWGIRCTKCRKHFWTGKFAKDGEVKRKNTSHKQRHIGVGVNFCALCNLTEYELAMVGQHLTVDHIKEIQHGGEDRAENTVLLCNSCHYLKNAISHKTKSIRKLIADLQGRP